MLLYSYYSIGRDWDLDNHLNIAQEALNHYSITYKSIELIGQSANTIYKITDLENNIYSLRLHRSKSETLESIWTDQKVIRSEMVWLHALTLETDVTLPSPLKNIHEEFITNVDGTKCTLVNWVEGEQKPFIISIEDAGYIGEMIGKLHRHSSHWNPPILFERPTFDSDRIINSLNKLKDQAKLGSIHAGDYLFDLGWTFSYIHPALREHLLKSYSMYYSLPDNYVEQLEGFYIAGQLETMNFWLGLPDAHEWLPNHIHKLAQREVNTYLKNESFLFHGIPYWE